MLLVKLPYLKQIPMVPLTRLQIRIDRYCFFSQTFEDLQEESFPYSTKYITDKTLLGEWSDHVICGDDEIFKCMATKMKEKYDKYWGDPEKMNKYIFIVAILDPRTKE
ncbi:zinc finger BED domain-containing protein RICESLEEPER 2-like [Hordeum vulgare]|nr:zinc finger BED domain-containing protein RICESLEEPER 2-like [Hordeum vulgare]